MPVEKLPTGKVPEGIAIIGMAGRFPGALSVDELMENIYNGVESTSFFRDNELDASVDQRTRSLPNYVKARNIIADVDKFDAAFFGFSPRIAEVMDPQQRVFLETAWAALESAGWDAKKYPGRIGVYAGMGYNTYLLNNVISRADLMDAVGDLQTMLGNDKDYLSTLVSYKFNLTGPALTIQTACSTSMVAICQAYYSLVTRQCDMALAGGVSITIPQESGYLYQEGSMLSKDGHTRPFDAQATGTVFGNGAGIIVLKRVEDAIRDHDHIYAVILGVGINNDGSNKVSYTAPSVEGQTAAIIMAQENAKVHPDTISYIETHGTATPLGDPIEIEALTQAFRKKTNAKQYCAIGSVKGNVGHVIAAAGVTGVIKTARQLQDKRLGPTLFYQAPNPNIDFANSPFYVNDQLVEWKSGGTPRRAAVSGFGIGGTNAHVILEEAPQLEATSASRPYQLLLLSARSDVVLDNATARLAEFLIKHGEVDLADVAFTLQTGRREFANRRAVVCRDVAEAIQMMEKPSPNRVFTRKQEGNEAPVAFMFPGQGSQYVNMGLNIYEREPLFRSLVDKCSEILKPWLNSDLRDVLYPKDGDVEKATHLLRETSFTQPALFTIEYSLARLWMSWGVRPTAMMGHSIGEFSAACLADVFSLEDALMLVARRGRMMQDLPAGAMLSVNLPAEQLEKRLNGGVSIAAVNGPSLCVASGTFEAIEALQGELEKEGIVCKKLHTSHAFHSPMMDPIVEPFAELVKKIPLSAPRIPFVSTVTADWITPQQATDPMYWARHLRAAVRFAESVTTVWQKPERVLLEVGPRNTAATLARQQAVDKKKQVSIASLGDNANDDAEWAALLGAVGNLWLSGVSLDWDAFYALETRRRIALPTYPFERKRFWAEPARQVVAQESTGFIPQKGAEMSETQAPTVQKPSRHVKIVAALTKLLEDTSGLELSGIDESATFMEMGMDSLTLTQVVAALQQKMNVKVTFRQMVEEYSTLGSLASHLEETLPADMFAEEAQAAIPAAIPAVQPVPVLSQAAPSAAGQMTPSYAAVQPTAMPVHISTVPGDAVQTIIQQQLQLMQQQLALLGGGQLPFSTALLTQNATPEASPGLPLPSVGGGAGGESTAEAAPALKKSILPERIRKSHPGTLNSTQKAALEELIARYIQRTAKSKQAAQTHRSYFADPRTVSGFSPLLKEVVYPIVVNRSSGSRLWDIDGNEYVDIINGFGSNFFGFSPPFLKEVMHAQLEQGIEIGPQTPLAGEVARMISEFVNLERVTFCNTGSEAVMGAMRLARTVTGKNKVVIFNGAYHGLFDEVIVRGTQQLRSLPAAPGVPPSAVENLLVLDYDTPEALEIIRNRADELAAILVEPVQSRHPDLQPRQFLHELRKITEQCGAALIMDEVITGFRVHPGGAQAVFDVRGDMATYGKVIGGGLPIGVIAGVPRFMDALDGGFWQFGDESIPTAGVTYFAGTFIRHPLALAAAKAALSFLKEQGGDLQKRLNEKSDHLADELNAYFQSVQAPLKVEHFGSLFKLAVDADLPYGELLYYYLRLNGIHSWDHRPFFLTIAHTDEDIRIIIQAFKKSVEEAQRAGFLPGIAHDITSTSKGKDEFPSEPPVPGARLGRDPQGNPQWFIPDPQRPGKYLSIGNKK